MNMKVSVPSKLILIGEHFVVYGAPALAFAVDRYNHISFEKIPGPARFEGINGPKYGTFELTPEGGYSSSVGRDEMRMYMPIYMRIAKQGGINFGIRGTYATDGIVKGMGSSASFSTALAYGLYKMAGKVPDENELFECAQLGEEIAHGGRPSGIDAKTVISGTGVRFKKEFDPVKFNFEKVSVSFPDGTGILVVDTFRGETGNTGELVKKFGLSHGISKPAGELTEEERKKVYSKYLRIYNKIVKFLTPSGNAEMLGKLFNRNHGLLKKGGVSTKEIEKVRLIAKRNGALGAKLTGAGGPGGAVIVYAWEKDFDTIEKALKKAKFNVLRISPAKHGPVAE